jgi:hypothetical protein
MNNLLLPRLFLSWTKIVLCIYLAISPFYAKSQANKNTKEQINITSSFKPSIIKTGKIEFDAKIPERDTSRFVFKYPYESFNFPTVLSPFSIKPLSYAFDENQDLSGTYIKLGYGNLSSPFSSLSWTRKKEKIFYSANIDHYSAVGKLPDQKISNTALSFNLKNRLNDNQTLLFDLGFDQQAYRLYGFDHELFSFGSNELKQIFNTIHLGSTYQQVSGTEGQTTFSPHLEVDYLFASRNTSEYSMGFIMPASVLIAQNLILRTELDVSAAFLKDSANGNRNNALVILPVNLDGNAGKFNWMGGLTTVFTDKKFSLLPNLNLLYNLNNKGLRLKAGIENDVKLNSLKRLNNINPFLISPDSISAYRKSDYFIGMDWLNPKGLQLNFQMGLSHFYNIPLFVNTGFSEKQFKVLQESFLTAFQISGGVEYVFDERLKFKSEIQYYHFNRQSRYEKAYGLLPLELRGNISWAPFDRVTIGFNAYLWRGGIALPVVNGSVGGGFPPFKLKDAADLGIHVDYKLNKKWALWLDLNNIANVRYQRWNKYDSFGFSFIGGIKYVFNQSK